MFECKSCKALLMGIDLLKQENSHLKETNKKLTDQVIILSNQQAYNILELPPTGKLEDYYGNEHDELIEYDDFGQKVLVKRGMDS